MQTLLKRLTTVLFMVIFIISTSTFVYADDPIDEYIDADKDAMAAAYQVFLNARGAGLTTASKKAFIAYMQSDTVNTDRLLGKIKRSPLSWANLSFRFNVEALDFLNQKLNDWVSQYDIATESEYENDNTSNTEGRIYSGEIFEDVDGNNCLVYHINRTYSSGPSNLNLNVSTINEFGTGLKYDRQFFQDINTQTTLTFNLEKDSNDNIITSNPEVRLITRGTEPDLSVKGTMFSSTDYPLCYTIAESHPSALDVNGHFTIFKLVNGQYWLGVVSYPFGEFDTGVINGKYTYYGIKRLLYGSPESVNIDIKAPTGVLPDLPTNTPMYITPKDKDGNYYKTVNNYIDDSTTYINAPEIQTTPPTDEPTTPDNPDTPTVPSGGGQLVPDGDGGFNFNFDLPDFSGFNFSIEGLNEKFPFSIPWDLMAFFTVLNAEPVTPELKGSLPFGDIYTWNFDFNLHEFDGIAAILRNIEFIAFCIGLMLITRQLIKG